MVVLQRSSKAGPKSSIRVTVEALRNFANIGGKRLS
jgi:hypothetical protein